MYGRKRSSNEEGTVQDAEGDVTGGEPESLTGLSSVDRFQQVH